MSHSNSKRPSSAMAEDAATDPTPEVLDIANNLDARVKFIEQERKNVIQALCVQSRKAGRVPDPTTEPAKALMPRLDGFLRWLENNIEITPLLKTRSKIDEALKLVFARPEFHFDEPTKERARLLHSKWEGQNWGKGEVVDEDSSDNDDDVAVASEDAAGDAKRRKSSSATSTSIKRDSKANIVPTTTRLPPISHPIFGEDGIMHGLVLKISPRRKDYIIDSRYTKRDAKVFGHNGIEVGSWWPMQLAALFHGAHGAKISGIAGNAETGAYSVVTSGGAYEELDQDKGDILYYSGSRSHDNEDPKKSFPSSNATLALKASQRLNRPVRVLRAAGVGGSKRAANVRPTVGIRYDGLYRVVDMQEKTNTKGGLYEQFKLVRDEGQPPLSGIKRPTASEIRDYHKRDEHY